MSKRQKLIVKISKIMAIMRNHMYYGRTYKAVGVMHDLKRDLIELRKVEK